MAPSDHPNSTTKRPGGAAGDGMDSYPTYHDSPASTGHGAGTKPTDSNLPRSGRTSGRLFFIGLIAFALVIAAYLLTGLFNSARTTGEAMTPGDPAAPTTAVPAASGTGAPAAAGTDVPESDAPADADAQAQPSVGPGEVEAAPGAADVPGGDVTTPVQPAPAQ